METPSRRYPKRLKVGSPVPSPLPPPVHSKSVKRLKAVSPLGSTQPSQGQVESVKRLEAASPLAIPQPPAVQSNGDGVFSLQSADLGDRIELPSVGSSSQELPPSSSDLNVTAKSLADLFSVYSYLRCFSRLLFLSPFSLDRFVAALHAERGDPLLDYVHLSLLQALKRHNLAIDPSLSNLGHLNWELLDLVTWPIFLVSFLRTQGYSKLSKHNLVKAGLGRGEYQKSVHLDEKLAILSFLCDHALQTEDCRTEVSVRLMYAHPPVYESPHQRLGEGDHEWRPQEARTENRVQENPLLRKASDRLLKSTEKGEWSKEVQRAATALGGDGNSNDCMLCGMDGMLLCCDACPAAYHSRCVGMYKSSLRPGDWFCPECRLACTGTSYSKRLQGAELLGMGPLGRYFLATCGYLLVSEVVENETISWCYGATDLRQLLKYLQACGPTYNSLQQAIRLQWELESISFSESSSPDDLSPHSSPRRASIARQSSRKKQKVSSQACSDIPLQETGPKHTTKQDGKRKGAKTPSCAEACKGPYINQYAHGDAVASAADTLATWQGGGDPAWVPGTRARGTSANEQVRAFTQTLPSFAWPSLKKRFSEKCGWCGLCSSTSRGCLLVQTDVQVSRHVDDLKPIKVVRGPRHLGTVAAYVLYLEEILHALLVGHPWEFPLQRQRWQSRLEESCTFVVVKEALLQLEASLRPIVLSTDWVKHADSAPLLWPACMVRRQALPWPSHTDAPSNMQCGVQWRRGGPTARLLCDWENLSLATLKRAGRQGGLKPVAGLLYNDTNAVPLRNKQCAWRARIESASSVAQVALQVRCFDENIKWSQLLADPGEDRKPFIYSKTTEAGLTKYLVAMTEEEIEAEKHNKDTQPGNGLRSNVEGQKQVWKAEQHVPLCQVKVYEEKLYEEKVLKATQGKKGKGGGNKEKGRGSQKRRSIGSVVNKLLEQIKLEEKKLEQKKPKSVVQKTPEQKKNQNSPARAQCQRCQAACEKNSLSNLEGLLVCGQCALLRQGKRLRKPTAKILEMLTLSEQEKDGSSPGGENGTVEWEEGTPVKLEWSGTALRKSGVKRKRINLNCIETFTWHAPDEVLGATENGMNISRPDMTRDG